MRVEDGGWSPPLSPPCLRSGFNGGVAISCEGAGFFTSLSSECLRTAALLLMSPRGRHFPAGLLQEEASTADVKRRGHPCLCGAAHLTETI